MSLVCFSASTLAPDLIFSASDRASSRIRPASFLASARMISASFWAFLQAFAMDLPGQLLDFVLGFHT
jgi:hypothetical protein